MFLRWLSVAAFAVACSKPIEPTTGLTGTVQRGPITPVCQVNVPCDAPFAASFDVWLGARHVATFSSDSAGNFTVRLVPGTYTVVPGADAHLMNAAAQTKSVTVGGEGLTAVALTFDTGIR